MNRSALIGSVLLAAALALAPGWALAASFSPAQAAAEAARLGRLVDMPLDVSAELTGQLQRGLRDPWLAAKVKSASIIGVFVYSAAEGGIVVKYMRGQGLASFKGRPGETQIFLRSWKAGAMIGGSATWGLGLVLGLDQPSNFGGDYTGTTRQATAVEENAPSLSLLSSQKADGHELVIVSAGKGLSADIGGERLTITPAW